VHVKFGQCSPLGGPRGMFRSVMGDLIAVQEVSYMSLVIFISLFYFKLSIFRSSPVLYY